MKRVGKKMKKDKLKFYTFSTILILILFSTFFLQGVSHRVALSFLLPICALLTLKLFPKKQIVSYRSQKVVLFLSLMALIYVIGFYLIGMFFGFYESEVKFGPFAITNYILPFISIIVSSEIIRHRLLSQKFKWSKAITFAITTLTDVVIYFQLYDATNYDELLTIIGFISFASVSNNLLYNYTSSRFGYKPVIVYRLITILYGYIIPITPNVFAFLRAVLRMIYPYIIYTALEYGFNKENKYRSPIERSRGFIGNLLLFAIAITTPILISTQFQYGLLVIVTGSMTGTIDIGDAILFEKYSGQTIQEGQIIIFDSDNKRLVHRVIEKKIVNGVYHYATKGDANQNADKRYVTDDKIIGIGKINFKYLGYPTIWFRNTLSNKKIEEL